MKYSKYKFSNYKPNWKCHMSCAILEKGLLPWCPWLLWPWFHLHVIFISIMMEITSERMMTYVHVHEMLRCDLISLTLCLEPLLSFYLLWTWLLITMHIVKIDGEIKKCTIIGMTSGFKQQIVIIMNMKTKFA
jgi:hypothetical protein